MMGIACDPLQHTSMYERLEEGEFILLQYINFISLKNNYLWFNIVTTFYTRKLRFF